MCICRQPDVRSDYTLLQIPEALHNSILNPSNQEVVRSRGDAFSSEGRRRNDGRNNTVHSPSSSDDSACYSSAPLKISLFEMGLRFTFIILLILSSFTMYRQQQEVTARKSKLLETMKQNRDSHN